ncbi:MAG: phosphoribosyltransferase [Desulfobacteraceae bacterium]
MAIVEEPRFRDKVQVFPDRGAAGKELAQKLAKYKNTRTLVLGIPSGGVPVAVEIARFLDLPLDLLIVRKVQIPWNPEAGFGAVNPDGEVIFNQTLLPRLRLSQSEIDEQVNRTMETLHQRQTRFRGGKPFPDLTEKSVIVVDDGLASGYTMLAASKFIQKRRPAKIVVAVPTGFQKTVRFIEPEVDEVVCLNIRGGISFAVAEAYQNWYDLTDAEVLAILQKYQQNNL